MAKKGAAIQLQIEVEDDEDWEKLVEREGLIGTKHLQFKIHEYQH